jgi:hypothetical protein
MGVIFVEADFDISALKLFTYGPLTSGNGRDQRVGGVFLGNVLFFLKRTRKTVVYVGYPSGSLNRYKNKKGCPHRLEA